MVMIARDAASPPSTDVSATASIMPTSMTSIGIGTPIMPVEALKTCCDGTFNSSEANQQIFSASLTPCSPVQAFAFPLFTTTALALPEVSRAISTRTGAALNALVVNTPAIEHSTSDRIRARSKPSFLIPHLTPAAVNPLAAVTPPSIFFIGDFRTLR